MLKSYVGIATLGGVEVFLPEHEHTVRFLARRSRRESSRRALCYWAVLPEEAAAEVERQLELGEPYTALLLLECAATEVGPIMPPDASERTEAKASRCERA